MPLPAPSDPSCFGYCERCERVHSLPLGASLEKARDLMAEFEDLQRLDYLVRDPEKADPACDFSTVLPGDRGHMFGVMECLDHSGKTHWLRAFSSLGTGIRDIEGWAPFLVETSIWEEKVIPVQREIKALTRKRNDLASDDPFRKELEEERKELSRELMPVVHDLYRFKNFRGEDKSVHEIFPSKKGGGIPAGVGDCCGPKLLNQAVNLGLQPVSMAEFFWGGNNRSGKKQPGQFFESCEEKCQPIMGYLLCGLE